MNQNTDFFGKYFIRITYIQATCIRFERKIHNEQNLEACFIRIFLSKYYKESMNNRNDMVQIFLGKCRNLLSSEQTDFKAI